MLTLYREGRNKLPVIKNSEVVKSKMNMLEALADIEIATKLMKKTDESDDKYAHLISILLLLSTNTNH